MGDYVIKWGQELGWALLVALAGALYAFLSGTDLTTVLADPAAAIGALGVVFHRVIGATVWNFLRSKFGSA